MQTKDIIEFISHREEKIPELAAELSKADLYKLPMLSNGSQTTMMLLALAITSYDTAKAVVDAFGQLQFCIGFALGVEFSTREKELKELERLVN